MDQKIEIILAEDQELFRKSLGALLRTQPEFELVAEVANGKELIEQLKKKPADVVLLDVEMPVMDGKKALEIIKKRFTGIKVIMLSIHSESTLISDFMALGAGSYICKKSTVENLFKAIRAVTHDGYFFDNSTSMALLDKVKDRSGIEVSFNERETEILRKICDGMTNKEIASYLNLSSSTIDFHKSKIYSKANCCNATELLKYALRNGIVALG